MAHFYRMSDIPLATVTRLGIFGGTFDPIHYGHLAIAEYARGALALDAVLFIPTGQPPHKARWGATAEQRYEMTLLATADHPQFFVSRCEIDRPGRSYTVETLAGLHAAYPQAALYFIIGADSAVDFHRWRAPEAILAQATVVAASRPGFPVEQITATPIGQRITMLPVPGLDISSTALRARCQTGESLRYLTPPPVAAYIAKCGLYRANVREHADEEANSR